MSIPNKIRYKGQLYEAVGSMSDEEILKHVDSALLAAQTLYDELEVLQGQGKSQSRRGIEFVSTPNAIKNCIETLNRIKEIRSK